MCHKGCLEFARIALKEEDVRGKSVIEVGSLDVNGTLRSIIAPLGPARYVGVDLEAGPGVDVVCDATQLLHTFDFDSNCLTINVGLPGLLCINQGDFGSLIYEVMTLSMRYSSVVPELPEGLLEQIRLVEPFVGLQQRAQGPSALGIQIGFVGQQRIAPALDERALFVIDALVLAASDPIQGIGQMAHDVELVVDDLRVRHVLERCVPERLPHVHDRKGDRAADRADRFF